MRAILYLLTIVTDFFCVLFLLRFIMQMMRVSFTGQIGNFVITLTNWAAKPLRRIIPGLWGQDWASLLAAFFLQAAVLAVISLLLGGELGGNFILELLFVVIISLLRLGIYIFIGALIVQAILSWVNPFSPLSMPIRQLTRPLLAPIQRFIPPISGIDLSPLVVIVLLQALLMILP